MSRNIPDFIQKEFTDSRGPSCSSRVSSGVAGNNHTWCIHKTRQHATIRQFSVWKSKPSVLSKDAVCEIWWIYVKAFLSYAWSAIRTHKHAYRHTCQPLTNILAKMQILASYKTHMVMAKLRGQIDADEFKNSILPMARAWTYSSIPKLLHRWSLGMDE